MKKLLLTLILLSATLAYGQGRHSLRVGAGTNLVWNEDKYNFDKDRFDTYSPGPTLHIDYGYRLNKYLELGANAFSLTNNYGKHKDNTKLGVFAKAVLTPLPIAFRYIRLGVGAGWLYVRDLWTDRIEAWDNRINAFACDVFLRAYVIDNERFELYGSYGLTYYITSESDRGYYWSHSNISIHFGVKF